MANRRKADLDCMKPIIVIQLIACSSWRRYSSDNWVPDFYSYLRPQSIAPNDLLSSIPSETGTNRLGLIHKLPSSSP